MLLLSKVMDVIKKYCNSSLSIKKSMQNKYDLHIFNGSKFIRSTKKHL